MQYSSLKQENDVSKSTNINPMKIMAGDVDQRGRNMVNRSLCYESHNSSILANKNPPLINQSFEYPSNMKSALGA